MYITTTSFNSRSINCLTYPLHKWFHVVSLSSRGPCELFPVSDEFTVIIRQKVKTQQAFCRRGPKRRNCRPNISVFKIRYSGLKPLLGNCRSEISVIWLIDIPVLTFFIFLLSLSLNYSTFKNSTIYAINHTCINIDCTYMHV